MSWWAKDGAGYTTDIGKAQEYTKEQAQAQHNCRETDIPWLKAYIDLLAHPAVDMQYVRRADSDAIADTEFYLQYADDWDGNDIIWLMGGEFDFSADLSKAFVSTKTCDDPSNLVPWSKKYIDAHTRKTVNVKNVKRDEALFGTGIILNKPQKYMKETYRCYGCGRIMSELQYYSATCAHCKTENRP